jgi:hypothetical protein
MQLGCMEFINLALIKHTFALVNSNSYEVIAGVDSNLERRLKWNNYFGIPTFVSI